MLGRVLAYAVMLLTPMVNVRALSVEEYGYYRQFWLLFETLTPLLLLGFPHSLMYYLPRAENAREKSVYVAQTLLSGVAMSLLVLGLYAVMANTLGEGLGAVARAFYWRLSAFTVLMTGSAFMDWLFVAERSPGRQSVYYVTVSSLQAIVVMTTSWYTRDVSAIIWSLTVFSLLRFLFAVAWTWVKYRPVLSAISLRSLREQLSYAFPTGIFAIVLVLVAQTDKFIISRFLGREAFAIYAVGAFQLPFVNIISNSVRSAVFPLIAQYQKEGRYRDIAVLWRRAILKMAALFLPMMVFLEVTARPVISILFTEHYSDATPVFMIYLLLIFRSAIDTVAIIQVFKRMQYLVRVFAAAFVVNLVLSLVLFRLLGREGVPLATVITLVGVNIVNLYYASRLTGVGFFQLLPLAGLSRTMGVAVFSGGLLWFACRYVDTANVVHLGLLGLGFGAVYLALSSMFGILTLSDLRSLLGRRNGSAI